MSSFAPSETSSRGELMAAVLAELELRRRRRASAVKPFRGAAAEAQEITHHEWMLAGPAETGKTFSALWRLDTLLRTTPRSRAAIVRKVRADMSGTVLETWEKVIAIRGGVVTFGGTHPEWYEYSNGARVYVGGMDRPGKVLSSERDFIFVNQAEELSLEDWETLTTRCTGRGAVTTTPMLFGDCNPGPPTHWILQRAVLRVLHSRHEDNPSLYTDAGELTPQGARTMAILDALTGVRKERLRFGRWVSAEGVVYEGFDRKKHLIDPFEIPADWRRIRSVDFGYTNPFVCQWWAIDPDGRMYLYREIYKTQRLVEDHARDIVRLSVGERIEATVADHDAEDRETLKRYGVETIAAYKAVTVGIQALAARLQDAGDKKPRLFILKNALVERDNELANAHKPVCTADEFEVYSWPKGADGKPMKEEPVKLDDHGMDGGRYGVAYIDQIDKLPGRGWLDLARQHEQKKAAAQEKAA
jgi:PBSX family phage terminase large subunit